MSLKQKKLQVPGLFWGAYPENSAEVHNKLHHSIENIIATSSRRKIKDILQAIRQSEETVPTFNSEQFKAEINTLRIQLPKDGFTDQLIIKSFSLINQAFSNIMNVRLFDTQMIAAYHMLNNRLIEMATGEGKTYAVALAASTAALSGMPIHVITANDYLADRDAQMLNGLYQSLGLRVDAARHGQEQDRRKQAYASDITYCTAKELVFDYLRDLEHRKKQPTIWHSESLENTSPLLLRGLCMAIIDEADSILIDEACVPLILSKAIKNQQENKYYQQSLNLACQLTMHQDFTLSSSEMKVTLNANGQSKLDAVAFGLPAVWHNKLHREETVCLALAALHLYECDHHYVVQDDKIQIIDQTTGRIAQGRSWSRGLHQLIELKENVKLTDPLSTLSQITYQRFFPKYFHLCGVSGTLFESGKELFNTYGLAVTKVPLRTPSKRKIFKTRFFSDTSKLNDAIVIRVKQLNADGRPILIGTESVTKSEALSKRLMEAGINHVVLNAKNDMNEAELVAKAGIQGAVTVTTNMAGRGTDIKINDQVNQNGGLHIISCQVNTSRRIDRQLIGRSARQGDNGSAETWISINSSFLQQKLPAWIKKWAKSYSAHIPNYIIVLTVYILQKTEERHQMSVRHRLLITDKSLEKNLAFGGRDG
jgi:preprotein translocase subunit SecA